jgi:hypothetical protein
LAHGFQLTDEIFVSAVNPVFSEAFQVSRYEEGDYYAAHSDYIREAGYDRVATVRAALGRLSDISIFLWKSILYGAFVWACRALNGLNWRSPARAVPALPRRLG